MKKIIFAAIAVISFNANSQCGIHTWHEVISQEGTWKVSIKMIHEKGFFVDDRCQKFTEAMLSPSKKIIYGFGFYDNADFDIAYSLTAVKQDTFGFQSPTCVFVISAVGPAKPQISTISYHGATCNWDVVEGVGENFFVG